ncbi:MAG: NADH:flavin oxidoreductase [Actinomycetota bacterium]|nr:NADH:flavin oxidoreductase [Actinomycetota bacterium]
MASGANKPKTRPEPSVGDPIFESLHFRNLTVKNRLFRSNISGRFDNYDGSGNPVRFNWEQKFARGGVGAIISSFVPVSPEGRIVPNYATIDRDERIPFWRELGKRVHDHDCRFIMQLSHSGRQRDITAFDTPNNLSSTDEVDAVHGLHANRLTAEQIEVLVQKFAQGARRAREAGLDGVETHSANGYLFTQFLSPAINDRTDQYGGSVANRARFLLEVIRAIRAEVGDDFHVQSKISAVDNGNAIFPWEKKGTTIQDTLQVVTWLEEAGIDAIHVSLGNAFPHPQNPAGEFPVDVAAKVYNQLLTGGGVRALRNWLAFQTPVLRNAFKRFWERTCPALDQVEGLNLGNAHQIKQAVSVPVICTGGFQTASVIRRALEAEQCDAVSMARTLVANNDLPNLFAAGYDRAPRPCTYCNKCLLNTLVNPLGCYDERRFSSREEMVEQIFSVYKPSDSWQASA